MFFEYDKICLFDRHNNAEKNYNTLLDLRICGQFCGTVFTGHKPIFNSENSSQYFRTMKHICFVLSFQLQPKL